MFKGIGGKRYVYDGEAETFVEDGEPFEVTEMFFNDELDENKKYQYRIVKK